MTVLPVTVRHAYACRRDALTCQYSEEYARSVYLMHQQVGMELYVFTAVITQGWVRPGSEKMKPASFFMSLAITQSSAKIVHCFDFDFFSFHVTLWLHFF